VQTPNSTGETADRGSRPNSPLWKSEARVILRCPQRGEPAKLMRLPDTLPELLDIGSRKFGCTCTKILTAEGAEVDEIELIRDGDHLSLLCEEESDGSVPKS